MRTILGTVLGTAILLANGCTRKPAAAAPAQADVTPALAAPVLAPMQARERLLHDTAQQQAAALARKAQFDAVLDARDH